MRTLPTSSTNSKKASRFSLRNWVRAVHDSPEKMKRLKRLKKRNHRSFHSQLRAPRQMQRSSRKLSRLPSAHQTLPLPSLTRNNSHYFSKSLVFRTSRPPSCRPCQIATLSSQANLTRRKAVSFRNSRRCAKRSQPCRDNNRSRRANSNQQAVNLRLMPSKSSTACDNLWAICLSR